MYTRTLGENEELTATYAKTVIANSKNTGVSYCLKHFPGYGNNSNTHTSSSVDKRTYEEIEQKDLEPFRAGIKEGAETVLVSHNIVTSIDDKNPASLSLAIHELLRKDLAFTGIIITDDLAMEAVANDKEAVVKAVLAENNLIISSSYEESIHSVKKAIEEGTIEEKLVDKLAFRVLAWKYDKGLLYSK